MTLPRFFQQTPVSSETRHHKPPHIKSLLIMECESIEIVPREALKHRRSQHQDYRRGDSSHVQGSQLHAMKLEFSPIPPAKTSPSTTLSNSRPCAMYSGWSLPLPSGCGASIALKQVIREIVAPGDFQIRMQFIDSERSSHSVG